MRTVADPMRDVDYDRHNQRQRRYFEGPPKATMVPRRSPYLERHIDEALAFGRVRPSDRILEIGCGMGRYTIPLAQRGFHVEGLDISPVLLDRLRAYGGDRLEIPLHHVDVINAPAEFAGAFDVVLGFFMLHHVHDLPPAFAAMARVLKPGGRLVFLEPNPLNPLYYAQIALTPGMRWRAERGMVKMRRSVIVEACAQAGLVDGRVDRFGFFPPQIVHFAAGRAVERVLERVPIWRGALPFQVFTARRP